MRTIYYILLTFVLGIFISCSDSNSKTSENAVEDNSTEIAAGGRYDLKSGIVTSKNTSSMMTGDMTTILYFDDHGKKSATESINKISVMGQNIETHTKTIVIDDMMYSWEVGAKTGTKMKLDMTANAEQMDYKNLSKEMMEQFKMNKIGSETVMGKKCDVFEMNSQGLQGKYYIWDNIAMKSETNIGGMNMVVEVTDLKENPSIPASTFAIPSDVTFTDMSTIK